MHTHQDAILRWISGEPGMTGVVVLAIGLVYGFYGFYFFKPLLALTCGVFGWLLGGTAAVAVGLEPVLVGLVIAVLAGGIAFQQHQVATAVASGGVWGILIGYLSEQFGFPPMWQLALAGTGGGFGIVFALLCYRTMTVVLTTAQGAMLMFIGLVGAAAEFMPQIGNTFRLWAASWSILGPVVMGMLVVTAFSYQSVRRQGNAITAN